MPRPSPSRDRTLRFLLGSRALNVPAPPQGVVPWRSLYQLAEATGVAFSWVHRVVGGLEQAGWVATDGRVEVTEPAAVFDWWREHRTQPEVHSFHAGDPRSVATGLVHEHKIPLAITTYYAENALQGHLFPRRLDAYVREADLARARAAVLDLGGQLGGTNLRLWLGDDSVPGEAIAIGRGPAELRYAPLPQIILDLMTEGGSAREAADLLIQRAYLHAHPRLS